MSDQIALDLFIQDFVNTNKLVGQHVSWAQLVNRRFVEDGVTKVFQFTSNGLNYLALGQHLALPDTDWLRIDLTRQIPDVEDHRFDCLRMLATTTHTGVVVERDGGVVLVKLTTRHRGLVNVVFVIRSGEGVGNPFLV
jgi:hypothetical protein